MFRLLMSSVFFLFLCLGHASQTSPLYQVDMIVFTHLSASLTPAENTLSPMLTPNMHHAIPLQHEVSELMTPYHTLPASASQLQNEYWALNRKPQYQVLFHYTWLQPGDSRRPIALSQMNKGGWNVEGTLSIKRSNYY